VGDSSGSENGASGCDAGPTATPGVIVEAPRGHQRLEGHGVDEAKLTCHVANDDAGVGQRTALVT